MMPQRAVSAPHDASTETGREPAASAPPGRAEVLRQHTPDILKDNAPRVVSALKIAGSLAMVASKNWAFRVAGSCFIFGNLLMMAFGHKKTDEERARLQQEEAAQKEARGGKEDNAVMRHMRKVFNPSKYPLEAGLTVFNLGSIFWLLAGAVGAKENRSKWYLLGGLLSLASDANGAFSKENLDDSEERSKQSKFQSTITYLKNRPVLTSSLLNLGADITTTVGGAIKYFRKQGDFKPMFAGSLILLANAFQAVYVNRNDYNIEKKQGSSTPAPAQDTPPFAEFPDTKVNDSARRGMVKSAPDLRLRAFH